jgi:hypothetical protein
VFAVFPTEHRHWIMLAAAPIHLPASNRASASSSELRRGATLPRKAAATSDIAEESSGEEGSGDEGSE